MVKEIPLTKGYVALVDDEDFERVNQFKWFASDHTSSGGTKYVRANRNMKHPTRPHAWTCQYMPTFIMPGYANVVILDGNPLNCQKENLCGASTAQRSAGRRKESEKSSKFKGVSWKKQIKRWVASIGYEGEVVYLGCFTNEEDAAHTYDTAAAEYYGKFARLNFPHGAERAA